MIRTALDAPAGVLTIALSRPDKRNALTPEMLAAIAAAAASPDPTARAILLRGEGSVFCSGFDLTLCKDNPGALADLLRELSGAVTALRRSPLPVVVAAHGAAIAGGCALLGGADFVITDVAAKLGYPVVRLGISPAVTAPFLRQSLGDGPTRERLFDPTLIDGRAAARCGIASECLDRPEQVLPRAQSLARELAARPPVALQATKQWLNELDGSLDDRVIALALQTSLGLVGSREQTARLAKLWSK
jgi:methylglutaconyl-CoA hydratase